MDYYAQLEEEYSISKKIEQAANGMTLVEAVAHLANSDDDVKKRFFRALHGNDSERWVLCATGGIACNGYPAKCQVFS